jgi:hypothetical protein
MIQGPGILFFSDDQDLGAQPELVAGDKGAPVDTGYADPNAGSHTKILEQYEVAVITET